MKITEKDKKRFWKLVDIRGEDDCWEWQGGKWKQGYGGFKINDRRNIGAHRFSYLINGGAIGRAYVLHKCDNPPCVNPSHLFLGNHQDNMDDMVKKKRNIAFSGEKNMHSKLSKEDVLEIREIGGKLSKRKMAKVYGVSPNSISNVIKRKTWKHI